MVLGHSFEFEPATEVKAQLPKRPNKSEVRTSYNDSIPPTIECIKVVPAFTERYQNMWRPSKSTVSRRAQWPL